ncbi:MAG: hypothetical protein IJM66_02475 [Muribaculaceae bacterium]|nr:hypothetical protein [Muribaculaceae bacterium]MBQ6647697.1 hypothetical protein [Muribaculaceae bacterium]
MKQDNKPETDKLDDGNEAAQASNASDFQAVDETPAVAAEPQEQRASQVERILTALGVSESVQASARAILEPIEKGVAPGESIVRLVVNALRHDEDVKNAEAEGYLRGRNEVIDAASKTRDQQGPQPVNFPIYRKTSFWE